jgi:hypothetical protein
LHRRVSCNVELFFFLFSSLLSIFDILSPQIPSSCLLCFSPQPTETPSTMPPATDIPYKGTPMPNSHPISPLGLTPTAIHPSVLAAEKLIYTYPRRFHDVEAAKAHIASICDTKGFKYGVEANASAEVYKLVKSRVCYHVAVRAFEADEFYLNTPLKDGKVLRSKLSTPSHLPIDPHANFSA